MRILDENGIVFLLSTSLISLRRQWSCDQSREYSLDWRKSPPPYFLFNRISNNRRRVIFVDASLYRFLSLDKIMSSEAPKSAKEAFVPKYEIAAGLHKGRKLEKFTPKHVRPTRRVQVIIERSSSSSSSSFHAGLFVEKEQTCEIRPRSRSWTGRIHALWTTCDGIDEGWPW